MLKKIFTWINSSFRRSSSFNIILVVIILLILFNAIASRIVRHYYEESFLEKGKIMAVTGAASIQQVFENAISSGAINEDDLFDTEYQMIANTDPQKYHTKYDSFTDENVVIIEDSFLLDHDITFAVIVDVNGYLPSHNTIYSSPLTGEFETDLLANRTKRIFDDVTGLAAAKNVDSYLLQTYDRDTGETMWDISAPIMVNGRHWGAFRIGLSTIKVQEHINHLLQWIALTSIFIAIILLLITYLGSKPIDNIIELSELAQNIAVGNISTRAVIKRQDEIGTLSKSLNMIIDSQQQLANNSMEIANGNLSIDILVRSENDMVALAFEKMVQNLKVSISSLHKEQNLLQTLLNYSVDLIYFKDLDSKFLRISKSQADRFGLENVHDADGKSDFDFFSEEHARPAYLDEQEIMRTRKAILYKEEEEVWPDKASNWVISSKFPLYDDFGNVIGTFGISRDITERKQIEDSLIRHQQQMKEEISQRKKMQELLDIEKEILTTTLMSISEGVITTDSDGLITFLNTKSEELTGFLSEEALDQPIDNILRILDQNSKQSKQNTITTLYEIVEAKKVSERYKIPTIEKKNGEKLLINPNISRLLSESNYIVGHVIVFDDITGIQAKETQTALSQKMESIGQMASGIAHEINTPIQYVGDNLRYLERAFAKIIEIYSSQKKYLDSLIVDNKIKYEQNGITDADIKKIDWYMDEVPISLTDALAGVDRVRKIVLAMREFSHPSGHEKQYSDINKGIETTVTISRNEWKYVADLELQLFDDLPLVNCYMDEINQVILNMVVNAAHAIKDVVAENPEEKGKITIKTEQKNNHISISIKDTGIGIPDNIIDRIFDPFFTTKGIGKGTGQGLFIAHNIIVNKHGGKIWVESEHGKGTCFFMEIPINGMGDGK